MIIPLTVGASRENQTAKLLDQIGKLESNKAYNVEIKQYRRNRSSEQNRFLWGVVYRTIIDNTPGPKLDPDHLHEYWLGECFGWDVTDVLGWSKRAPMKRSSKLSTTEFIEFHEFIQRRCAETRGLYIPDPGEFTHEGF